MQDDGVLVVEPDSTLRGFGGNTPLWPGVLSDVGGWAAPTQSIGWSRRASRVLFSSGSGGSWGNPWVSGEG